MRILIFGGTGGMGKLTAGLLTANEHTVTVLGSKDGDVRNLKTVTDCIEQCKPELIINMAVYNSDAAVHKLNSDEIEKQLDVNVKGALNVLNAGTKFMREQNFGRIILISSVLSTHPVHGTSVYSASKGFVDNLVKTAAIENVKYNVTVNSIQLGYFEAGLIDAVPEEVLKGIVNRIPMKRLGKAQELVNAIDFIVKTPYFTGSNLPLFGGLAISSL